VETSIRDLAAKINHRTGNPAPLLQLPKRAWDNSGKRYGSTRKARDELGFEARVGIDAGLRLTVEWTKRNLALIQQNIDKHDAHMKP
jgi:nucleoside-diphosphate-sugar epimerase